jgi:hypothetical protein
MLWMTFRRRESHRMIDAGMANDPFRVLVREPSGSRSVPVGGTAVNIGCAAINKSEWNGIAMREGLGPKESFASCPASRFNRFSP